MTTTINASTSSGIVQTADTSGILKVQSNGVTTNALAWVNFDGTTSPGTIRASYNVSSVTRNATGDYSVNFATALSDANYAYTVSASLNYGVANFYSPALNVVKATGVESAPTASACRFGFTSTTPADYNPKYVNVSVLGN
jgi:hypothetical protein